MKKQELIADIEQTIDWLKKTISLDTYNMTPFEGSWTAAQVVEHINMVGTGFNHLLNGATQVTNRPVDQFVSRIKTMFLNFDEKAVAAPNVTPAEGSYNLQEQMVKLDSIKSAIINDIKTLDMNMTCVNFEIPTFGYFTRLEAVYFFLFHTKRHVHQLQNIVKSLSKYQFQS
ncbi:MAG: DinB family protein [Sphingobacteriaceae bacterium]|nr:MAG: DinB family protein [Sphingobacteriaceae bacterium]